MLNMNPAVSRPRSRTPPPPVPGNEQDTVGGYGVGYGTGFNYLSRTWILIVMVYEDG